METHGFFHISAAKEPPPPAAQQAILHLAEAAVLRCWALGIYYKYKLELMNVVVRDINYLELYIRTISIYMCITIVQLYNIYVYIYIHSIYI